MKNLSIFNVYVEMESQEQCDRMKQLCVDNGLDYWNDEDAFLILKSHNHFVYSEISKEFWISYSSKNQPQVTEAEFIELLKQYKDGL